MAIAVGLLLRSAAVHAQALPPASTAPASTRPAPELQLSPHELGEKAWEAYEAGDYQRAIEFSSQALTLRPDQPKSLLVTGLMLIDSGRSREAVGPLNQYVATAAGRNDYRGYEALGDIALKSRYYRMAEENYTRALPKAPQPTTDNLVKPKIQIKLAHSLAGRNLIKEAIEAANKAIADAPKSPEFQWEYAKILFQTKKMAEAVPAMQEAARLVREKLTEKYAKLRMDPDAPPPQEELALLNEIYQAMLSARQQLLQQSKEGVGTQYHAAAKNMAEHADIQRQIAIFNVVTIAGEAVKREPQNVEFKIDLATYQMGGGMTAAAARTLDDALKIDPNHARARELLGRLRPSTQPAAAAAIR